ncbi:MAG: hypothetical protein AAF682_10320 [Planctomycetota bacterium]
MRAPARSGAPSPAEVQRALGVCGDLIDAYRACAVQAYGLGAIGEIDLPPLSGGRIEADQVRVAAVAYWLMELERAGLPSFVEALAKMVSKGRIVLSDSEGAAALMRFQRRGRERFQASERRELFSRLFGGTGSVHANDGFAPAFRRLAIALAEIGRHPSGMSTRHLVAAARIAAEELGGMLSNRTAGFAAFAAEEMLAHAREALGLLRRPDLRAALGGLSAWETLRVHGRAVLGRPLDPDPHLRRAQAGAELIRWIGANAAQLASGAFAVERDAEVLQHAEAWLAAEGLG